ncbi:hypothetical protein IDJ77_09480 [Mucilaginibacter sp. ZT4R22]|uniref:DUF4236 domain-containing protein n=1 Tax=Mucilaginibacter pankratovii TaxID=2772110 RepID=A0ABR7WPE6_9SPHI|nr:hypothetical protein [Mucilaginibacter pankratovii]MBD1364038.1 hypothetical protein [Mucilaginibacter pankratovii]
MVNQQLTTSLLNKNYCIGSLSLRYAKRRSLATAGLRTATATGLSYKLNTSKISKGTIKSISKTKHITT